MNIYKCDFNFANGTPARVHRPTGNIFLAKKFFEEYSPNQQRFILAHELGHYRLNTKDETLADAYAASEMIDDAGLKATFRALNESLHNNPFCDYRRLNLYNNLAKYDNVINNNNMDMIDENLIYDNDFDEMRSVNFENFENEDGFVFQNDFVGSDDSEISDFEAEEYINFCDFYGLDFSDMSKGEYRRQKRQAKIDSRKAKTDMKLARADKQRNIGQAKLAKGQAKLELGKLGVSGGQKFGEGLKDFGKSALGVVGSIFGGGAQPADQGSGASGSPQDQEKSKLPMIIGIVVAVIILGVVVFLVLKKKK